ncbi:Dethiobiotin synthetase [Stanieria cyanosphaera PCC 7437]|uniref:ATP-dependent dethiobiotin synthetase BioD n=1 Tax=Stanieria cyanosphaera (strain ATCC 29371 / PCC 7437) TaxID=111780 RepID=K9XPZ1_STAC7|nr:dethiobiotin synthase [Stanieria cyanosphaera]AFZ34690.1 Dethiobiotin synthetase [Stanieria cyanosphaera PCC 7437]
MGTLLITGTDTDVGKTVLTTALVSYWQSYRFCRQLGLMKLLQTGTGDCELYQQMFAQEESLKIVTPISLATPLAPPLAAVKENTAIDLGLVWQALKQLREQQDFVLVEALGGLGSPVTEELTVADLAADWHLPTVLVVPVKLGAIAQVVANVALARSLKVNLRGIVLSCSQPENEARLTDLAPVDLIESLTQIPVLGTLPYLNQTNNHEKLAQVAANLDLEFILPV